MTMTLSDKEKFLAENSALLWQITNIYKMDTPKFSTEDLFQEANLSAFRALDHYDSSKGVKPQTFVYLAVYRDLRDYVRKNKHDLYVSQREQKRQFDTAEAEGREVDISDRMAVSLQMPIGHGTNADSSNEFVDIVESGTYEPITDLIKQEQVEILLDEIDNLDEREADIMRSRYFDGKTYLEIAKGYDLTTQRIEQIHSKALKKLKKSVQERLGGELHT